MVAAAAPPAVQPRPVSVLSASRAFGTARMVWPVVRTELHWGQLVIRLSGCLEIRLPKRHALLIAAFQVRVLGKIPYFGVLAVRAVFIPLVAPFQPMWVECRRVF